MLLTGTLLSISPANWRGCREYSCTGSRVAYSNWSNQPERQHTIRTQAVAFSAPSTASFTLMIGTLVEFRVVELMQRFRKEQPGLQDTRMGAGLFAATLIGMIEIQYSCRNIFRAQLRNLYVRFVLQCPSHRLAMAQKRRTIVRCCIRRHDQPCFSSAISWHSRML